MKNLYSSPLSKAILILVVNVLFLAACTTSSAKEPAVFNPTRTVIQTTTAATIHATSVTVTPPPVPISPTLAFTRTPAPILPTHTPSAPVPTPTITPVATLSIEEEGEFLSELMSSNGGCKLPCWWGVTPSETAEQEARDQFVTWGINQWHPSDSYRLVSLGYPYPDSSFHIHDTAVKFWVENDTVEYIHVNSQRPKQGVEIKFYRDWQFYQVNQILNRFGQPVYIRLEAAIPHGDGQSYILGLSYPSQGIDISYGIQSELLDNGQHQICFELPKTHFIALSLYKPDWVDNVPGYIIPNHLEEYISLESITGLNPEEFYEIYRGSDDLQCMLVE